LAKESGGSGGPEKVGGLIAGLMQRLGLSARLEKQSAVTMWAELIGPKLAEETKALRIDGDTLIVKVERAAWRQQLTFMKPDLVAKLESALGKGCVKDIKFI